LLILILEKRGWQNLAEGNKVYDKDHTGGERSRKEDQLPAWKGQLSRYRKRMSHRMTCWNQGRKAKLIPFQGHGRSGEKRSKAVEIDGGYGDNHT